MLQSNPELTCFLLLWTRAGVLFYILFQPGIDLEAPPHSVDDLLITCCHTSMFQHKVKHNLGQHTAHTLQMLVHQISQEIEASSTRCTIIPPHHKSEPQHSLILFCAKKVFYNTKHDVLFTTIPPLTSITAKAEYYYIWLHCL